MKVATFVIRADARQSARWKQTAEGEGFASVGAWAASALDAYLENRRQAGRPLALAWRRGRFKVRLDVGEVEVGGWLAPPFAHFRGDQAGLQHMGIHLHTLVYAPQARILATFKYARHARSLAAELARLWVRWGGREPAEDPAPLLQRFQREDL